jgi:hypothetical protein
MLAVIVGGPQPVVHSQLQKASGRALYSHARAMFPQR